MVLVAEWWGLWPTAFAHKGHFCWGDLGATVCEVVLNFRRFLKCRTPARDSLAALHGCQ